MTTEYKVDNYDRWESLIEAGGGIFCRTFQLTTTAQTFGIGDTILLAKMPKGAVVFNWFFDTVALDSGSVALTVDLGFKNTAASDNVALDASTAFRAGGVICPQNNPNGLVAQALPLAPLQIEDVWQLLVEAAGAGAVAAGVFKGWVMYHCIPGTVFEVPA